MKTPSFFYASLMAITLLTASCTKNETPIATTVPKVGSLRVMAPTLLGKWIFTGYKNDTSPVAIRANNKVYIIVSQQTNGSYLISGKGLVNNFSMGIAEIDPNNPNQPLKVNLGISTLIGGTVEDMTSETIFLARLAKAKDVSLLDDKLTINVSDGLTDEAMNFSFSK